MGESAGRIKTLTFVLNRISRWEEVEWKMTDETAYKIYRRIGDILNENAIKNPKNSSRENVGALCFLLGTYMSQMDFVDREKVIGDLNKVAESQKIQNAVKSETKNRLN